MTWYGLTYQVKCYGRTYLPKMGWYGRTYLPKVGWYGRTYLPKVGWYGPRTSPKWGGHLILLLLLLVRVEKLKFSGSLHNSPKSSASPLVQSWKPYAGY